MVCRSAVLLAVLTLTASAADAQRTRVRVALPAFGAQVVMDTLGEERVVAAPPARVFHAARLVLANLKIPVDIADSAGGMIGAAKLVRSRNVAGQALSRYLECGSNMSGPRADSHRIQMPLLLILDAAPEGQAKLRIALVVSAQDNSGSSSVPVMCGSTGVLENQIRKAIDGQLRELP